MIHTTSQSGFSLVETLVAITILLLVIIGPLTISSSTVRSTAFASEQVAAFFLAQEGAELAQKGRDDFLLDHFRDTNSDPTVFASANPDPWSDFKGATFSACSATGGCGLSTNNTGDVLVRSCSSQSCLLYLDTRPGQIRSRYTYDGTIGSPTIFTRTVTFSPVGADEVSVVSTVTWRSGFSKDEQRVSVQTSLFNVYATP